MSSKHKDSKDSKDSKKTGVEKPCGDLPAKKKTPGGPKPQDDRPDGPSGPPLTDDGD
jgi:hypothetical protein